MFETGDLDIGSWEVLFVRKVSIFIFLLWNLLFSVIVTDTTIPSTQWRLIQCYYSWTTTVSFKASLDWRWRIRKDNPFHIYIFACCGKKLFLIKSFLQPCGEVHIVDEDVPLRTPRDAFGKLVPVSNLRGRCDSSKMSTFTPHRDTDEQSVANSEESFEGSLTLSEKRLHYSAVDSLMDGWTSSDDDQVVRTSNIQSSAAHSYSSRSIGCSGQDDKNESGNGKSPVSQGKGQKHYRLTSFREKTDLNRFRMAPRAFWPHWVYRMYDSYHLAQRAAGKFLICFDRFLIAAQTLTVC